MVLGLVPQALDRVEPGRLACWKETRGQTDEPEEHHGDHSDCRRDLRGSDELVHVPESDELHQAQREDESRGLHRSSTIVVASRKNCPQDVLSPSPDGALDPDFPGPLADHDVHDVGYADASYGQGEGPDDREEHVKAREQELEHLLEFGGVPHAEGVVRRPDQTGTAARALRIRAASALRDASALAVW